jgi:hypothetical protein
MLCLLLLTRHYAVFAIIISELIISLALRARAIFAGRCFFAVALS